MEWIKTSDRLPLREDGDKAGYIVCWKKGSGFYSDSWVNVDENLYTHWAKIDPPKE